MKFHIRTYGCQMNERDSEAVSSLLTRHSHNRVADESEAEIIIVNTCSVRAKAEDKALGKLGLLLAGKPDFPGRIVGAMGCMVQRLKSDIFEKIPGLHFAIGTHSLSHLPDVLDLVLAGKGPILDAGENGERSDDMCGHMEGSASMFVNILLGCDRNCTYCVVPKVRGKEWSRPANKILEEIRSAVSKGAREVILLGQSVMSYGRRNNVWPDNYVSGRGFKEPLPRLLEAVSKIDGLKRIRFTSGHSSGCTEELVRAMAELPAVCEHLHLPLQSGSDRILKMMCRGYTTDDYRRSVERLRAAVPCIAITTDVIVGFPSETIEDFEITRSFMKEIGFDNSFIFKYSSRPSTPAAQWADNVPADEKMRRNKVLLVDQDIRGLDINKKLVGNVVEVLVEGVSLRNTSRWAGRTRTNKIVAFEPVKDMSQGNPVNVKVERAMAQTLYGQVVNHD